MNIDEVLKFADDLVFKKTGKHLDDVQESVIKGVWDGQKYLSIANSQKLSEGHIRDIAYELWHLFSEYLGENVSKSNFRSRLKKLNLSQSTQTFFQIHNLVYTDNLQIVNFEKGPNNNNQENYQKPNKYDLQEAPPMDNFYGRNQELNTLNQWILTEKCPLISIVGISGIGKTALTIKLISQISENFDYIIYRSLADLPTLETLINSLIEIESSPISNIPQLIDYLRRNRYLIILDDVQSIFQSQKLAGTYKIGYENYSKLFQSIAKLSHQSCLILNSWETPKEISKLNSKVHLLQLGSLAKDNIEILQSMGLQDEKEWETLIKMYEGNPAWLKIISTTIIEVFKGKVAEFINCNKTLFLSDSLQDILDEHFEYLTTLEKQILSNLASNENPVIISQLLTEIGLDSTEVLKAIQSLTRRFLLEIISETETLITVNSLIREYLKSIIPFC